MLGKQHRGFRGGNSLPVLFHSGFRGKLSLRRLIEATATLPAKIFHSNKGELAEGFDADIVLVDPKARVKIRPKTFLSKAKYSPFKGDPSGGPPTL